MTLNTPAFLQNLTAGTPANIFRQQIGSLVASPGVCGPGEYAISQSATPAMSVVVGPGRAFVQGTYVSDPTGFGWNTQGMYGIYNDANVTVTVAAANASNPRIDLVYLQIPDSFYSGSSNTPVLGVVTGTAAASPLAPTLPANSIQLGLIAVGAGVTSIVNANITVTAAKAAAQLLPARVSVEVSRTATYQSISGGGNANISFDSATAAAPPLTPATGTTAVTFSSNTGVYVAQLVLANVAGEIASASIILASAGSIDYTDRQTTAYSSASSTPAFGVSLLVAPVAAGDFLRAAVVAGPDGCEFTAFLSVIKVSQ